MNASGCGVSYLEQGSSKGSDRMVYEKIDKWETGDDRLPCNGDGVHGTPPDELAVLERVRLQQCLQKG